MLLEARAQPNAKMFFYKRTPAHCAAASGCHEALRQILDRGGAVRARDKSRLTLLHDAARGGDVKCIQMLLEASAFADMEARDKWGRTPLHWTVLNGSSEAARLLIQHGAELEPRHQPRRIQRRRTSLVQPPSLRALAVEMHPATHPIHSIFEEGHTRKLEAREEGDSPAGASVSAQRSCSPPPPALSALAPASSSLAPPPVQPPPT
mmetsp:Transcript_41268/g.129653  ORF Transcript_41268/g.129653 Transcript_41268/m.129653 type:complete len:207 (+) Transcript_41268:302-922(+)